MRQPSFLTLASTALLLAACTRTPTDTAAPPAPETARAPQATTAAQPGPAAQPPAQAPVPAPTLQLAVSGEGLTFVTAAGSTRHLPFGEPADQVVEAVSRALGTQPAHDHNDECGAGPLDISTWPDGLMLTAQEGRFVGWSTRPVAGTTPDHGLGTMAGIGPGSTRGDLESAYAAEVRETTLGTEFTAGGLSGLLDGTGPDASITTLWAGTTCTFR